MITIIEFRSAKVQLRVAPLNNLFLELNTFNQYRIFIFEPHTEVTRAFIPFNYYFLNSTFFTSCVLHSQIFTSTYYHHHSLSYDPFV